MEWIADNLRQMATTKLEKENLDKLKFTLMFAFLNEGEMYSPTIHMSL